MGKRPKLSDADRKRDRAGKGTLLERQVSARCRERYAAALEYFFFLLPWVWGRWPSSWPKRDEALCHYIECLWAEGEAKSRAADTISALQWKYGTRAVFPGSWRRYKTWNTLEISQQTPPLPVEVMFALCGLALRAGHPYIAVALYTAFHCMLRTREMLCLHLSQVRGWHQAETLVLTDTKTTKRHGETEYIAVEDPVARILLRWARLRLRCGPLISLSETKFRSLWSQLVTSAGLQPHEYLPYSIRRGGATFDYLDCGSLDRSLLRGRWQSIRAARIYVREGEEMLQRIALEPAQRTSFEILRVEFLSFVGRAQAELQAAGLG